ncbi:anthrone oxygenase family protein [Micromonospora sp. DT228]|uniref:anthrone oxygenase family protein n=1 Tax=Micromonospora sp. DT228 TaxID=3393443 RepID=UPI003CF1848B
MRRRASGCNGAQGIPEYRESVRRHGDHRSDRRAVLPWIVAGLLLHLVVLGVTAAVNVPLNNVLARAGDTDTDTDLAALRQRFEASWVPANVVRAVASTGAFGLLAWALVEAGRPPG